MLMYEISTCQCSWAASGCTKPVPFLDGDQLPRDNRPAALSTRRAPTEGWSAGWADRHYVGVEHHERQPAVALVRMRSVVVEDRPFLQRFEPPVSRHAAVVLVGFAVAAFPVVELALGQVEPSQDALRRHVHTLRPTVHVVHDFVACVVGNPNSV